MKIIKLISLPWLKDAIDFKLTHAIKVHDPLSSYEQDLGTFAAYEDMSTKLYVGMQDY